MKKLLFITLILILNSCSNKIIFERKVYNSSYPANLSSSFNTANIKMEVVEAKNSDSINKVIFNTIKDISNYLQTENLNIKNYNDLTKNFITTYKTEKNKSKSVKQPKWEYTLDSNVAYENDDFVNIVINYFSSLGDVEGFGAKRSLIFDRVTGNQLKLKDLFVNLTKLTRLTELKFREKYKLPLTGLINTKGFWFENNKFQLTENVIFDIEGATFFYNINEVGPYEKGTFEVFLSYEEIEEFYTFK